MVQQNKGTHFEKEYREINSREGILEFEEEVLEADLDEPRMYEFDVTDSGFYAVSPASDRYDEAVEEDNNEYVPRKTPGIDVYHDGNVKSIAFAVPDDEEDMAEYLEEYIETKFDGKLIGDGVATIFSSDDKNNMFRGCIEK
jgi:hypothetical protein